jgi:drug/metabolite transporter (DMT)-like permease
MNPARGIGLKILATLLFAIMGALVRALAERYPIGQLVFMRSFFAVVPVLVLLAWRGEIAMAFRIRSPWRHLTRGLVGSAGMFTTFLALKYLPLADATAIGFATPLFAVVMAVVFLGEVVRVYRWSAVAVGFVGVVVMLWPHLGAGGWSGSTGTGAMWALAGAVTSATAMTMVRHMTQTETTWSIVFWFSALCALVGLMTAPLGWPMPDLRDASLFVLMGLVGGVAQLLLTDSYRHAAASVLAPFDYLALVFAVTIGFFVFAEVPEPMVLVGAAIVILAGLAVIWRERQLGLERAAQRQAQGPVGGG